MKLWLQEAKEARHRLMTGKRVVDVWVMEYGRTRYSEPTAENLDSYIAELERDIQNAQSAVSPRAPIRLLF